MPFTIKTSLSMTACAVAILAAGCGADPKAANEANFETALNNYFSKYRQCITVGGTPDAEGYVQSFSTAERESRNSQLTFFKGLVDLELMETSTLKKRTYYRFTETAKPFLRPAELDRGFFATGHRELCFATAEVLKISNFTEPSDSFGLRASSVKFTYKLKDIAPWANDPVFTDRYKWLPEQLTAESLDGDEELVLTNNGWVHHQETE